MNLGIAGKIALVTASSRGLGAAIAQALAAEGVHLALFARDGAQLESNAAELRARHGVRVLAFAGDMRLRADVERCVAAVKREFGGVDILALNTGRPPVPMRDVLDETDDERWDEAYRTQLKGAILVAQMIAPILVERRWGRVIAVTSASVKQAMPHHALSTVFRAGVTGYMRHLANEVADKGVTVNLVCPASIATDALVQSYDPAERIKRVPMRRLGRPEELAATVAFLASDLAGFITGQNILVDGGMVASTL